MLLVCLNESRGDSSMIAAVSKELMELDMGDKHDLADLVKCDYSADPAKLQIIIPIKPDFLRNFWLTKANKCSPTWQRLPTSFSKPMPHLAQPSATGVHGAASRPACATALVLRQRGS